MKKYNLKAELDKITDEAWDAVMSDKLTQRDRKLLEFLCEFLAWWSDLWAVPNKEKFGNDGIDCMSARLEAA